MRHRVARMVRAGGSAGSADGQRGWRSLNLRRSLLSRSTCGYVTMLESARRSTGETDGRESPTALPSASRPLRSEVRSEARRIPPDRALALSSTPTCPGPARSEESWSPPWPSHSSQLRSAVRVHKPTEQRSPCSCEPRHRRRRHQPRRCRRVEQLRTDQQRSQRRGDRGDGWDLRYVVPFALTGLDPRRASRTAQPPNFASGSGRWSTSARVSSRSRRWKVTCRVGPTTPARGSRPRA